MLAREMEEEIGRNNAMQTCNENSSNGSVGDPVFRVVHSFDKNVFVFIFLSKYKIPNLNP